MDRSFPSRQLWPTRYQYKVFLVGDLPLEEIIVRGCLKRNSLSAPTSGKMKPLLGMAHQVTNETTSPKEDTRDYK